MVLGSPIYSFDEPYQQFNSRNSLMGSQRDVGNTLDGGANMGLGSYLKNVYCTVQTDVTTDEIPTKETTFIPGLVER